MTAGVLNLERIICCLSLGERVQWLISDVCHRHDAGEICSIAAILAISGRDGQMLRLSFIHPADSIRLSNK